MRDELFKQEIESRFHFDQAVASVFDDMLGRSVPFYEETKRLIVSFALRNLNAGDRVYDLGCSTASILLEIANKSQEKFHLIGVDNSEPMIERARHKARAYDAALDFCCEDLLELELEPCQIVIANYTIQFVRPVNRPELLKKIYQALRPGGVLILGEKVISEDSRLDRQMIDEYYDFKKRQGYSELEILRKREALENVLVPYTVEENRQMLLEAGFSHVEILFKWVNFTTFIARKADG